ncbi:MAG: radical SAM protein [Promethearchaeota archaeon]
MVDLVNNEEYKKIVRIIQISDIHFGSFHKNIKSIKNGYKKNVSDPSKYLYRQVNKLNPDFLFFCGDYATGKDNIDNLKKSPRFNEMLTFLKDLKENTKEKFINFMDRVLIVPGNHDIKRGEKLPLKIFKTKFKDYLTPYTKKKFAPLYIYNDLKIAIFCLSTVEIAGREDPIIRKLLDFTSKIKLKQNSEFKEIRENLKKRLFPDIPAITNEQYDQFIKCDDDFEREYGSDKNKFTKIILCHHSFIPIQQENLRPYSTIRYGAEFTTIARHRGYQIITYGHSHQFNFDVLTRTKDQEKLILVGAPSLSGKTQKNGFVLIDIKDNRELHVSLYFYNDVKRDYFVEHSEEKNQEFYETPKITLKYFENDEDFEKYYQINKILSMVKENGNIHISGRSLLHWANNKADISKTIEDKKIKFKMVLLDPKTNLSILDKRERYQLERDIALSLDCFYTLREKYKENFNFRLSNKLFWESIVVFPKEENEQKIAIYDIHTGDYVKKLRLEIKSNFKLVNYLDNRIINIFEKSKEFLKKNDIQSRILEIQSDEIFNPDQLRQNNLKSYNYNIPKIFDILEKNQHILPPLCIQIEITNQCNSKCLMCERHLDSSANYMKLDDLSRILQSISNYNVKNIIFSGGEPTLHSQFSDILRLAKESFNLNIGILSNGLDIDENLAKNMCKFSDWIRISVDGTNKEIINKIRGGEIYNNLIKSLCNLKSNRNDSCNIGMCYTIQKENIDDFEKMLSIISNQQNNSENSSIDFSLFSHFSFKFAHGKNDSIDSKFLCSSDSIEKIRTIIDRYHSNANIKRYTNLKYLSWFIDKLGFDGISSGKPCKNLYNSENEYFRCFATYIFSIIDTNGEIYPCCHLYYDNNNTFDPYYNIKRNAISCGNLRKNGFNFEKIWESEKYNKIRKDLEKITLQELYEQCADCTRFFYHNYFLTKLYDFYKTLCPSSQNDFKSYFIDNTKPTPIWF